MQQYLENIQIQKVTKPNKVVVNNRNKRYAFKTLDVGKLDQIPATKDPKIETDQRLSEEGTLSIDVRNISNFKNELEDVFKEIKQQ